jgi:NADPH-dependent 2,4-dienoyl-CoA reductase/sulfur reductase-like enzyme
MMHAFRYILVGGGMAAAAAVEGIRRHDPHGSIGLFSQDRYPPYSRPPLSKGLWRGKRLETIWRYHDPAAIGVTEHLNATVTAIAPQEHRIHLSDGRSFTYDRLLLATGAEPRRLPGDPAGVHYLRGLDDYLALFRLARGKRFAVIGGGFIGAEMASALRDQDKDVHMVFPESAILESLLPADLAQAVSTYYQDKGVHVSAGLGVQEARAGDGQVSLRLSNGEDLEADAVVAGLGVQPRTELAEAAGLYVQDGIVVDSFGRTSDQDIYAAGDVARIPVPALATTLRVEHEDNAIGRGRVAGANMAGAGEEAVDAPLFYSDLFDLGFEAVGVLDSRLETYADWAEPYRRGVVYYVGDGRVQGVLNWNVWDQVTAARTLLGTPCAAAAELKGKVPLG